MYECLADYHYDLYAGCDPGIGRGGDPRSGESDDRRSTRESGICR